MNGEFEHQVYTLFLALWAGYLFQAEFNFIFAAFVVTFVALLVLFLRRSFQSQVPLRERIIRVHSLTLLITLLIIPNVLFFTNHFFHGSLKVSYDQVAFLAVIVLAWIISVELARYDQDFADTEWRAV